MKEKVLRTNRIGMANQLNPDVLHTIRQHGSKLSEVNQDDTEDGELEYSMPKFLRLYKGYDFLQNLSYVIVYMRVKHDLIDNNWLYIMCYLYPKNIFSLFEYSEISFIKMSLNRVSGLEKKGFVRCIYNHKNAGKRLYQVTLKGRRFVEEFYKLLAGEEIMDEDVFLKKHYKLHSKYHKNTKKIKNREPNQTQKSFWTRKRKASI